MPSFTSRLQIKWGKLQFSCTLASCYIYDAHKCINILEWLNRKHNFTVVITLFHTHLLQDTGTEQSSKENTSYHTPSLFSFMCKTPCMQNYRVSFVQPIEWSNWLNITKCSFSVCLEMLMPHIQCLLEAGGKQKKSLAHNQNNRIRSKYSHSSYKRMARCAARRNDWARGADAERPVALDGSSGILSLGTTKVWSLKLNHDY